MTPCEKRLRRSFADIVRKRLWLLCVTQVQVANAVGLTGQQLSLIMREQADVELDLIARILFALGARVRIMASKKRRTAND